MALRVVTDAGGEVSDLLQRLPRAHEARGESLQNSVTAWVRSVTVSRAADLVRVRVCPVEGAALPVVEPDQVGELGGDAICPVVHRAEPVGAGHTGQPVTQSDRCDCEIGAMEGHGVFVAGAQDRLVPARTRRRCRYTRWRWRPARSRR